MTAPSSQSNNNDEQHLHEGLRKSPLTFQTEVLFPLNRLITGSYILIIQSTRYGSWKLKRQLERSSRAEQHDFYFLQVNFKEIKSL